MTSLPPSSTTPTRNACLLSTSGEKPSPKSPTGIGTEGSSFSQVNNNNNTDTFSEKIRSGPTSTDDKPLNLNPPSTGKSKGSSDPEHRSSSYDTSDVTIPMIISTIFQRFLVRMPHTFIAMAGVFVPLYYGLDKEGLAISATTFVGVGGTVYCFVRAFFLETIPEWMLPKTNETKLWRRLMDITYTCFITAIFTTAVWKLPDITTAQGFGCLAMTFGAPYPLLAKFYNYVNSSQQIHDIDNLPRWFERKNNTKL